MAGKHDGARAFIDELTKKFIVGNSDIGGTFAFNGYEIISESDKNSSIRLYMDYSYYESTTHYSYRRHQEFSTVITRYLDEKEKLRSLGGNTYVLDQRGRTTGYINHFIEEKRLGDLRVIHITVLNRTMDHILKLEPVIWYVNPGEIERARLFSICNSALGGIKSVYGKSGSISEIRIKMVDAENQFFLPISWTSHKHQRYLILPLETRYSLRQI